MITLGIRGLKPAPLKAAPLASPGVSVSTPLLTGVLLELAPLLYTKLDALPNTNTPLLWPGASVKPPPGNGTSENSLLGPATVTGIFVPIAVQAPAFVWLPT